MFHPVRKWVRIFTVLAWLLFVGLALVVTDPLAGIFAGNIVAIILVCIMMLLMLSIAVILTMKVSEVWPRVTDRIWSHMKLVLMIILTWTFIASAVFLTSRSWRATESAMERIARETVEAGIWVTPNLVLLDKVKQQNSDEFYTLIQHREMRYLRANIRDRWINKNRYRKFPDAILPMQFAIWQSWNSLMSDLTMKLHEANVPLLAGSDTGTHGVFPGSSLHDELRLLVQSGLSPYEALRTATVNPAIYLEGEKEFGKIVSGFRADLVLLTGNPLEDIENIKTRVGVMKLGRWFNAVELEAALEKLAEERK
jgi:hypothetical protein